MAISCNGDTYVETIERTECIGNSLAKINANFTALDIATCTLEGTTSQLNNLQGILKGNGNGGFEVADPDYDYYIPGRPLYTNFKVVGAFECLKTITIGDGDLIVTKGSVACVNLISTGNGSFTGNLDTRSALTVGGKGSFEGQLVSGSLTVNGAATVTGTLNVTQQIVGSSSLEATSVTTPSINVTGASGLITVPTITVTSAINANANGVVSSLNRANIATAVVTTLTAHGGVFLGSRLQTDVGTITDFNSSIGRITSLATTTAYISTVNTNTINSNVLNLADFGPGLPGKLTTNEVRASLVTAKVVTVENMINGQNLGILNVPITQTNVLNAASAVNTKEFTSSSFVTSPIGNIATVNATTVNTTSLGAYGTITAGTGLTVTTGNLNVNTGNLNMPAGTISARSITLNGTSFTEGVVDAKQKVVTPLVDANKIIIKDSGSDSDPSLSLTGDSSYIKMPGNTAKIYLNGPLAEITLNGTAAKIYLNGASSLIDCKGTIQGKDILATSTLKCNGDIIAYANTSDQRLKNNIEIIPDALDKISTLRGVNFTWNEELQSVYQGADTGIIAQEVEAVMPTAVTTRDTGYKAVKYERLIPLLIEAVKELKEQNVALREEIEALKTK